MKITTEKGLVSPEEELVSFYLGSEKNMIFSGRRKVLDNWKRNSPGEEFFLAKDNF